MTAPGTILRQGSWMICLTLLGCGACSRPEPSLSEAHAAAIRDSLTSLLTALARYSSTGQWDSLSALYSDAPEFHFVENGVVRYRSAAAIRTALAGLPAGTRIESTYRDTEIDALAPGLGAVTSLFETSFIDSAGGRFGFGGAVTLLVRHEAGGWRILRGHSSSPAPPGR